MAARRVEGREPGKDGRVFTAENGELMAGDYVANRYARLVEAACVPAIRFQDRRTPTRRCRFRS